MLRGDIEETTVQKRSRGEANRVREGECRQLKCAAHYCLTDVKVR